MARKAFVVTEQLQEQVRRLAARGVPQEDIAKIIGCAPKTLRRRFRQELNSGAAEANVAVAGFLFSAAKGGSVPAQIFWTKTMGKRGKSATKSASAADNAPPPLRSGPIILPDGCHEASHDPELRAKVLKVYDKHNATKYRREQRKRARQAA
jgi:hypothetical protein